MYKKTLIFIFAHISFYSVASQKNNYYGNQFACSQQTPYLVSHFEKIKKDQLYSETEKLLNAGFDPNYRPSIQHLSPLMWAMKNNEQEVAWLLLVKGASPDHVLSYSSAERNMHYTNVLPIIKDPHSGKFLRINAFMFGEKNIREWLWEYVTDYRERERHWKSSTNGNSYIIK